MRRGLHSSCSPLLALLLAENGFFEALGDGEPNLHSRRDLNRLAGLRISTNPSRRPTLLPAAEVRDLHRFAFLHGVGDHLDHVTDEAPCLALREAGFISELFKELRVRHLPHPPGTFYLQEGIVVDDLARD